MLRLVRGVQDSATGDVRGQAGKAAGAAGGTPHAHEAAEELPSVAQVSFLTAALMGVALCFHSVLEVRPWLARAHPISPCYQS